MKNYLAIQNAKYKVQSKMGNAVPLLSGGELSGERGRFLDVI